MPRDKARPGIVLYFADFAAVAEALDDASLGRLWRALMLYGQHGEITEFDEPALKLAFGLCRPRIDSDNVQYIKKVRHAAYMSYKAEAKRNGLGNAVMDENEWIAANYPDGDLLGVNQEPNRDLPDTQYQHNSLPTQLITNYNTNTNPTDPAARRNYYLDLLEQKGR